MKHPEYVFAPTANEYPGIGFADHRFLVAIKKQIINK